MKLSRLLKCMNKESTLGIRIDNDGTELNFHAGNVPFWLTQRKIISTDTSEGKLSVVVSEEKK